MNVGQRIKERRNELGMSVDMLAEKLGKNRSTVYRYENGDIENMPIDIIKPIAAALQTTPQHLLGWDQEEINAVSEMQSDVSEYNDAEEEGLKSLQEEFAEMHFTPDEIRTIRNFMYSLRRNINFSSAVKAAREKKDFSVEQLAEKLGVQTEIIKELENVDSFQVNVMQRLYEVLGITYHDLFDIPRKHSKLLEDIWFLRLNDEELNELYKYAKYLKSQRQ